MGLNLDGVNQTKLKVFKGMRVNSNSKIKLEYDPTLVIVPIIWSITFAKSVDTDNLPEDWGDDVSVLTNRKDFENCIQRNQESKNKSYSSS